MGLPIITLVNRYSTLIACMIWGMASVAIASSDLQASFGWEPDTSLGVCKGSYLEPLTESVYQLPMPMMQSKTSVSADLFNIRSVGESHISGNVVVSQPGRELTSDEAILIRGQRGDFERVILTGHVVFREAGRRFTGDSATVDLIRNEAWIDNSQYRLFTPTETLYLMQLAAGQMDATASVTSLTLRGHSKHIWRDSTGRFHLTRADLTSCPPVGTPTWQLHAGKLVLNPSTGWGSAQHVRLTLKSVPLLYIPYIRFPIDSRRQSGILYPQINYSNSNGLQIAQPIYWNMAPNFDGLLTPQYLEDRGMFWKTQLRYLTSNSKGHLQVNGIWDDRKFRAFQKNAPLEFMNVVPPSELKRLTNESDNRAMVHWQHVTAIAPHWRGEGDFNWVSDDYFLQDFHGLNLANTNDQLRQAASLRFSNANWDVVGQVLYYDALHPINRAFVAEQYGRLPSLNVYGDFPARFSPFEVTLDAEMVNFWRDQNPGENTIPVSGMRYHVLPNISLPLRRGLGAYFIPSFGFDMTQYDLSHNSPNANDITRTLPIINVDTGVNLERGLRFGGKNWTQTLSPRVYYLYIPEQGQSEIPLFDTGLNIFTFDQLFRTNRFNGLDRINDANQLSYAVTTRLLTADKAIERARFSIGQIVYFQDRNVRLCVKSPMGCIDNRTYIARESISNTARVSPLVAEFNYALNHWWQFNSSVAYRTDDGKMNNATAYLQFQPGVNQFFHAGYTFLRAGDNLTSVSSGIVEHDNLEQLDLATMWPVSKRLQVIGRWNYNLSHRHSQAYLYGLEYENCCWALRFVAGRTYKGVDENNQLKYNRAFYIQFQFKGLGQVGSDPSRELLKQLRTYQDTFAARSSTAFLSKPA